MFIKLRNAKKVGTYLSSVFLSSLLIGMTRLPIKYDPQCDQDSEIGGTNHCVFVPIG